MKVALLLATATGLLAQSSIDVPHAGEILDARGSVRELRGVAGGFTLGPAKQADVVSIGCDGRMCLAKTASQVVSGESAADAPSGTAIFGFDAERALIFFQKTREFARWSAAGLEPLDWQIDAELLALRPRGEGADFVVRRDGNVYVSNLAGDVREVLPRETIAALLLPSAIVCATADAIVLRRGDGHAEIKFEVAGVSMLYESDATHAVARAGEHLFLVAIDRAEIFELPGGDS